MARPHRAEADDEHALPLHAVGAVRSAIGVAALIALAVGFTAAIGMDAFHIIHPDIVNLAMHEQSPIQI